MRSKRVASQCNHRFAHRARGDADQLFSVMTACVAPAFTVTVWVAALKLPPVTLTTVEVANTGS
jgi:hypothetical protein